MQVEATRLYRVKDVAEHFDVSAATIYRAIECGQLDALKLGGTERGTLRIAGAAVLTYAETCGQAAYVAYVVGGADPTGAEDDELSPAQADGLACVVCGTDFLAGGASHVPVGRSASGSQTFACIKHDGDDLGAVTDLDGVTR